MSMTPGELIELANQLLIVAGRIPGVITVTGPPANTLGAVGSSAFWAEERTWYGPKTAEGWPPGVVVTEGPQGLSAKQIVINAGLLPESATDAQFATWLADAQIDKVQPLVDAAEAARNDARQTLTDTEAFADQIIEDSTPDITVTAVAGAPGTPASVVKGGTLKAPTFEVTVPRGSDGTDGVTPNVSAEVTLVATGQPAVVTRSGPDSAPVFTFQLPRAADGADGREVEMQSGVTHLQWRYVGEATWTNLFARADFKGDQGEKGDAFAFDAKPADLAARAAYDAEPEGFTVLVMDTGMVYARVSATAGVWSDGFPFGQTQNAILTALSELNAAPGLLYQEDGATFSKRAIGAAADTDVLDRQAADARYRRQGQAVPLADVTGLPAALDEKADAAATLAMLGDKAPKADTYTKGEVDAKIVFATVAEVRAGSADGKIISPKVMADALATVVIARTDAAVGINFDSLINATITLDANGTLGPPLGGYPGKSGVINVTNATGSATMAFASAYRMPKGGITIEAGVNASTRIPYMIGGAGAVILFPASKWSA